MGFIALGTIGTIKVIGSAATLISCIAGLNSLPDTAFRRKLSRLYRTGDICVKKEIKKQGKPSGHRKIFPITPARSVQIFHDHIKATIILPDGLEPKEIWDRYFLFKQVFGEWAHLEQKTEKVFQLSVWPHDLRTFPYDLEKVLKLVKGMRVPVYVGMSRTGNVVYDMVDYPNLLIAGEPGSGKSVALRQILTTLLFHIKGLELYCADLKRTEFHLFEGIAKKVVYDEDGLRGIVGRMESEAKKRGNLLNRMGLAHVDDLPEKEAVPYIVIAIDEVAMLESKTGKALMQRVAKVIAVGRALGIYFIMSMQRPDKEVLNGRVKNCLTVRMAFRHTDITNSQISLGAGHGEAADIKPAQKGRTALLLDGVEFVQVPFLDLDAGKALLADMKRAEEAPEEEEDDEEEELEALPGNVVQLRPDDDDDEDDDL